jgi:YHS domain-containing protein
MGRLLAYLFDFVIIFVLAKVLGRVLQRVFGPPRAHFWSNVGTARQQNDEPETHGGITVRDPVCGTFVSTELPYSLKRGSETLHFCSRECLERYQREVANAQS